MNTPKWVVTEVVPHENYTLQLAFADGTRKTVDMRGMLEKELFSPLKNVRLFMKAKVDCGSVSWTEDLDIAPEWLYEA